MCVVFFYSKKILLQMGPIYKMNFVKYIDE